MDCELYPVTCERLGLPPSPSGRAGVLARAHEQLQLLLFHPLFEDPEARLLAGVERLVDALIRLFQIDGGPVVFIAQCFPPFGQREIVVAAGLRVSELPPIAHVLIARDLWLPPPILLRHESR